MDVCESQKSALHKKHSKVETSRVSFRTPSPSVPSGVRRCSSLNATRTFPTSVERKRPAMPSSPPTPSPSTPVADTGVRMLNRLTGNKLNENLWPSTMRSLSVPFQSDTFSLPVNKREKPAPQTLSDQSENSRPVAGVNGRLGSRHPSSKKASVFSSSLSRGVGPSQTKTMNFAASRGITSSRVRSSSPLKKSNNSTSVLSFIVDIRKGKKDSNHIEDAHQLRLLYNRHLQWMFVNARAHAVLQSQKVKAEIIFYDVWRTISEMWDLLIAKRIEVQRLLLALRLYSVLGEHLAYLEQWALVESDHTSLVSLVTEDLRACTLRLPITGSARGDIGSVKSAVCSTLDIMQAMASSICSLLSPVEGMNRLITELANVGAHERAMLIECRDLLASTTALQAEEYSIRTNLIQLRQSSQLS